MELTVTAHDRSHRMHRKTTTRTFRQMTVTDIARKMAGEHGLKVGKLAQPRRRGAPRSATRWGRPTGSTSRGSSQSHGGELDVAAGALHIIDPSKTKSAAAELVYGETLQRFRPRVSGLGQAATVDVRGWDVKKKTAIAKSGTPKASTTVQESSGQTAPSPGARCCSPPPTCRPTRRPTPTRRPPRCISATSACRRRRPLPRRSAAARRRVRRRLRRRHALRRHAPDRLGDPQLRDARLRHAAHARCRRPAARRDDAGRPRPQLRRPPRHRGRHRQQGPRQARAREGQVPAAQRRGRERLGAHRLGRCRQGARDRDAAARRRRGRDRASNTATCAGRSSSARCSTASTRRARTSSRTRARLHARFPRDIDVKNEKKTLLTSGEDITVKSEQGTFDVAAQADMKLTSTGRRDHDPDRRQDHGRRATQGVEISSSGPS